MNYCNMSTIEACTLRLCNPSKKRTLLARMMGVRIASTITMSSGLSGAPARDVVGTMVVDLAAAEIWEPILSIRRDASILPLSPLL